MNTIQNQAHSCQVALGEVEGAALGKLPKSANLRGLEKVLLIHKVVFCPAFWHDGKKDAQRVNRY